MRGNINIKTMLWKLRNTDVLGLNFVKVFFNLASLPTKHHSRQILTKNIYKLGKESSTYHLEHIKSTCVR